MGIISSLFKAGVKSAVILTVIGVLLTFIPNLPPYTQFTSIEMEPVKPRDGVLSQNNILNNAQQLYKGLLLGPEAFVVHKSDLYTSLASGKVIKISPNGQINTVTQIGRPCNGLVEEHICGRPLGLTIDSVHNIMYVADAYHGIWKVDLETLKKQLLVSSKVPINGADSKIFMSPILDKNGVLYWDHVSTDYDLKDGVFTMLSDPSGRLFKYDMAKNKSELLLDNLWFPNGMAVSPDNQFIAIAETCRYRIIKYYINGPKKGTSEVLVSGLPGAPDNIQSLPDGSGFLVALYTVFDEDEPSLLRSVSKTPLIRKFLTRAMRLTELSFEFISEYYPHVILDEIVYHIGHFKSVHNLIPATSGLLHIDWEGNIVGAYFNSDGTASRISDAIVFNDKLYMGSPHVQDYIAAVPVPPALKKAFIQSNEKQSKVNEKSKGNVEQNKSKPSKVSSSEKIDKNEIKTDQKKAQSKSPQQKEEKPTKNQGNEQANIKKSQVRKDKTVPNPKSESKENTKKDQKPPKKPEQIPIKEELVSDTIKPKEEKLKVIKKTGPMEMPLPHS